MFDLNKATAIAKASPAPGTKDKTPIPAGTYNLIIKDVEWDEAYLYGAFGKDRKQKAVELIAADPSLKTGKALHVTFEVADGPYTGRLLWETFLSEMPSDHPKKDDLNAAGIPKKVEQGNQLIAGLAFFAHVTNDDLLAQGVSAFANKLITVKVTQWQAKKNYVSCYLPRDGEEAPKPVVNTARPVAAGDEDPF